MNSAATAGLVFAGGAHVVLHVAGAENAARIDVFESSEDFLGRTFGHVGDDVEAAAMAHAHDELDRAEPGAGVENFVDQRDQGGDAFEREAFAAEITLLHHLLEDIGTDEQVEDAPLIFLGRLGFDSFENPAAALRPVDVIDFDADGAGIDGAGFASVLAFALQFGSFTGAEKTEGIEIALKVSPLSVDAENALAFGVGGAGAVGSFDDSGAGTAIGGL